MFFFAFVDDLLVQVGFIPMFLPFGFNFIEAATKIMLGLEVKARNISYNDIDSVCVKSPLFSFTRLRGVDPRLGVEMRSTGEVACFGRHKYEAFLKSFNTAVV